MLSKAYWISLLTLARREVMRVLRIWPQSLLPPVMTMSLYFVVFGSLIGPRVGQMHGFPYIQFIAPGLIMMSAITNAYTNVSSSFFSSKFQRSIEEIQVSPMPPSAIILGFTLGGVVRGLFAGLLVMGVALFFTRLHMPHPGMMLLVIFLSSFLFALAGLFNGIFAQKFDDVTIIPTFVITPLTYLGGVFYSIQMLHGFWLQITLANPILYLVNAFRYGMLGISDVNPHGAIIAILGFIVMLYTVCWWLIKTGRRMRS
ncbi:MAG: transport permease protein [marine bacterium B5-7]|nr:MAG: transport permease protein [marine bacterium B5-7]